MYSLKRLEKKGSVMHRIKSDETLLDIAKRYNTSIEYIEKNTENISTGQWVLVKKVNITLHIVRPLETLNTIALLYNVDVNDIILKNNLVNNKLFLGQRLEI